MNHAVVIDASVLVKVFIVEEFSDRAEALLADCRSAGRALVGPSHVLSEVTNAIHKQVQQRNITGAEADQALSKFLEIPISLVSSPELYLRAIAFAREHRLRHTYDSIYAVLAQMVQAEFWTDDREFLRAVEGVAPWVRWIGDYPYLNG